MHRVLWAAVIPALVAAQPACTGPRPASAALRFNAEQQKHAAAAPRYADRASPAFTARFRLLGSLRVPLSPRDGSVAGLPRRPAACALSDRGEVYLTDGKRIDVWTPGSPALRPFPLSGADAPRAVTALYWAAEAGALYVLDGARHQVRRYAPDARLAGLAALNAGQTAFTFVVTPAGDLLAGGVRSEDAERTTLVSVHDALGRHRGAFLDMDPAMARSKAHLAPPVLLALARDGSLLAQQPSSPWVLRVDGAGHVLQRFGGAYEGYRPVAPLADAAFDFDRTTAWTRGLDHGMFLQAGARVVFSGFGTWRHGRKVYRLEVFDRAGRRVATGLEHDSQPMCGRGEELVLVSMGSPDEVEITRWRYTGPVTAESGRSAGRKSDDHQA